MQVLVIIKECNKHRFEFREVFIFKIKINKIFSDNSNDIQDAGAFEIATLIDNFDKQMICFTLNLHMNNLHDKVSINQINIM